MMKIPSFAHIKLVITVLLTIIAFLIIWGLWDYYMNAPWTRDGKIRADVVEITPDVSGWVTCIKVTDNQFVRKDEVLFTIDRERYELALKTAEAILMAKKARMEQAMSESKRYRMMKIESVSAIDRDQKNAGAEIAKAEYNQALSEVHLAKLNIERTQIKAPLDGYVTNFDLRVGNYASAGHPLFALVAADSFYVMGYFEETKLSRIQIGDPVDIALMGNSKILQGHVNSIASGIVDRERSASPNLLANVNPTFSWVRLAQRIPVRITLDQPPGNLKLVAGQTVTVAVKSGKK